MPVLLVCPVCEKKYRVSDESKADGRRCLQCSTELCLDSVVEVVETIDNSATPAGMLSQPNISLHPQNLPEKIGRFQIRSVLGAGAFGRVFRAFDSKLLREVALKVPHTGLIDGAKAKARFFREAVTGARLQHPHIVQVYDAGQDGDHVWIASAYIKGKTLKQALEAGPSGFEWHAHVIRELANALFAAHQLRIVHRDVKPANIMIDKRAEPYLMDFGLAWLKDASTSLTHVGAVIGTPAYMSPEQAAGMKLDNAFAADQYSLGVVFYEMLCHELPFEGPADYVISCHKNQSPVPPRNRNPKVPVELDLICMKMLAKLPADRYLDCQAVANDLQRWRDGKPIKAIPMAPEGAVVVIPEPVRGTQAGGSKARDSANRSKSKTGAHRFPRNRMRRRVSGGRRVWPWIVVGFLALLVGAAACFYWDLFGVQSSIAQLWAPTPAPPSPPPVAVKNKSRAVLETSAGRIVIELYADKAPITVKNFVQYVEDKHYDGTLFHRVIKDFMIQGGGYESGMKLKKTRNPIKNESDNGLSNERGTVAMARTAVADSATAQFYINVKDNSFLDRAKAKDKVGNAVFGRVVEGMDVVDQIRATATGANGGHGDVPNTDIVIKSIRIEKASP